MADATLTATLLPAMGRGEPLTLSAPVSPRLVANVATLQDVFVTWSLHKELMRGMEPVFRRVQVDAPTRCAEPPSSSDRRVAAFFSGGLDSLYTACRHRHEEPTLVFAHGLDVPLAAPALRGRVIEGVRRAAAALDLPLIEVATDLRTFSDTDVDWLDAHGAALATIAHLLAPQFGRFYVPASESYATLRPLGSHPLVDPLWASERIELVHDGLEANRLDKLRAVADEPAAHTGLRVCVRPEGDAYNCGTCWKCTLTIVGLRVLDLDEKFTSIPHVDDTVLLHRLARPAPELEHRSWERHRIRWDPYVSAAPPELRGRLRRALTLGFARVEAARWSRRARAATRRGLSEVTSRTRARPGPTEAAP
ncbi:MAG: hypothetical protein ACRDY4_11650 [Acidimicrobiia bacterium]